MMTTMLQTSPRYELQSPRSLKSTADSEIGSGSLLTSTTQSRSSRSYRINEIKGEMKANDADENDDDDAGGRKSRPR
jgi:hypothetical protein